MDDHLAKVLGQQADREQRDESNQKDGCKGMGGKGGTPLPLEQQERSVAQSATRTRYTQCGFEGTPPHLAACECKACYLYCQDAAEQEDAHRQAGDPVDEIDRIAAISGDAATKENFLYLRGLLRQKHILLGEMKAEAIKGSIRSALLAAESLQDYATRRKVVINGNINLEKMKKETQSPALLESLERAISRAKESLRMLDAALDHYAKFYLDRVRECQDYPADLFEDQLEIISLELELDEDFIRSLRGRLGIFARHVALYKERGGNISLVYIQNDILSNSPL